MKTNGKRLAAAVVLATLTACDYVQQREYKDERADRHYQAAMADYSAGRLDAAAAGFEKAVKADHLIKLVQNAVEVIHVIAGVGDVAGVKTDAIVFRMVHAGDNFREMLKAEADFRSLARHCFKTDHDIMVFLNGVECFFDCPDACLQIRCCEGSGMQDKILRADGGGPFDFFR